MKSVMLTLLQQKRVWENMLGAEIRENYFADLSGRYANKQRLATWFTLLVSSGAAVSMLTNLPDRLVWIRETLAIVAAAISLHSVVMQNQKFAVDSSDLHARWGRLAHDYQGLWTTYIQRTPSKCWISFSRRRESCRRPGHRSRTDPG